MGGAEARFESVKPHDHRQGGGGGEPHHERDPAVPGTLKRGSGHGGCGISLGHGVFSEEKRFFGRADDRGRLTRVNDGQENEW